MQSKKLLFIIARGLVSISLLYYLFSKIGWDRLSVLLSEIQGGPLIIAPIILIIGYVFSSVRWRYLLEKFEVFCKTSELYVYYLIGAFYSIFLPGVIGGDIIRIGMCTNRSNGSLSVVSTSVLVERTCGVIALFLMGSVAYFFLPQELTVSTLGYIPAITLLTVSILIVAFSIVKRYKGFLTSNNINNRFLKKAASVILLVIKLPYFSLFMIVLLSSLFQASDIIASYTLAKVLNLTIPLSFFFVILPITYVITTIPVSLGGLGVREGVLVYLLTQISITPSDAVTLSFLIYCNRVFVASIGGITQIFWKKREKKN